MNIIKHMGVCHIRARFPCSFLALFGAAAKRREMTKMGGGGEERRRKEYYQEFLTHKSITTNKGFMFWRLRFLCFG